MNFGDRLKELREKSKLKQKDIAEKLIVSRATIGKYETNVAFPDLEKLIALANLYNCSVDYLLGLTDIPNKFTDKELSFFRKTLELTATENGFSISNPLTEEQFNSIYDDLKTAFMTIRLLKRIANKPFKIWLKHLHLVYM